MPTNTPKRYRLKKDLPDAVAGVVLTQEKPDGLYMYCGKTDGEDEASWYVKDVVENNPDWFEPIPNTHTQALGEFVWTDALVCEFFNELEEAGKYARKDSIEKFKQAKAAEQKPSAQQERDWEIISFKSHFENKFWGKKEDGFYHLGVDRFPEYCFFEKSELTPIHSIRRLSDGCVFSVGDEVVWETLCTPEEGTIQELALYEGCLKILCAHVSGKKITEMPLSEIQKPKQEKKDSFTKKR